jgi:hypothetical protein
MGLKRNGRRFQDAPLRYRAGQTYSFDYSETNRSSLRNIFVGGVPQKGGLNAGALPPASWIIPQKSGLIASFTGINSSTRFVAAGSMGVNGESSIATFSTFSGVGNLIVRGFCNILTSSSFSSSASGALYIQANINTQSFITSTLGALAGLTSNIVTESSFEGTPLSFGNMTCEITPFTELSPQTLAGALWSSIAAEYNSPGTMGEKLNSAGGSNSPVDIANAIWNSLRTDYNDPESMGLLVKEISEELDKRLKKTDFIALK